MVGFSSKIWRRHQAHSPIPACSGYAFTDLPSQVYWDSSRAQSGKSGILTCFVGGKAGESPLPDASARVNDMERVFPGLAGLHDGNQAVARWAVSPYSLGSYACPRVGHQTSIVGSAPEPELAGRLLFAGEHASILSQGFMNGAVETGNAAARKVIAAVRPLALLTSF
jgi:monoamine oxidase